MKYELPSTELIVIEENNYLKFGEYLNDMQCDDTTNKLCLDDLEYVKKLQEENKQLKEELVSANESITWWNNRFNAVTRDNKQLKDNWNKLKQKMIDSFNESQDVQFLDVLQDMQEIEQGSDK